MGKNAADPQQGGSKQASVREFLQGGGSAGATVWGGDVGSVAKNGAGAELLCSWVSETDYREAAAEKVGREMSLPLTGGGNEGSRVHRIKNVYKQKAEQNRAIHCNVTASGPTQKDSDNNILDTCMYE